mmetsp:Transcript_20827/g.67069  ORF Transcript_20827/g.67069 Transcript_20827/m.67069 type:complete len:92 (+) Transcript_20827:2557-2832(+)
MAGPARQANQRHGRRLPRLLGDDDDEPPRRLAPMIDPYLYLTTCTDLYRPDRPPQVSAKWKKKEKKTPSHSLLLPRSTYGNNKQDNNSLTT